MNIKEIHNASDERLIDMLIEASEVGYILVVAAIKEELLRRLGS